MSYIPTVLAGPSGVGKGTVLSQLCSRYPQAWLSISVTTRPPRPGERDGEHYFFLSEPEFDALIDTDGLLEWATYQQCRYGTPRAAVMEKVAQNRAVLMELDIQGVRQVKARLNPVRTVFLAPPSWEDLVRRLTARGTESETAIGDRLETGRMEMRAMGECDHVVVNGEVASAVAELVNLIGLPID